MIFSLRTLLLTGRFDPLSFGATREQVLSLLGPPDLWGPSSQQTNAPILRYGSLEFYFPKKGDGLWMIFSDHLNPLIGSASLTLAPWILHDGLTLSEAETALKSEQIDYALVDQTELDAVDIVFPSGAVCRFERSEEAFVLNGFWLKAPQHMNRHVPTKQLSVTLPLSTYEKLRRHALRQNKSISHLSSEWLAAYIDDLEDIK